MRDVNLLGVDSVEISHERRLDMWGRLASDWKLANLEGLATEATLADVPDLLSRMLQGGIRGTNFPRCGADSIAPPRYSSSRARSRPATFARSLNALGTATMEAS